MGVLHLGDAIAWQIPDAALRYLQPVLTTKLRRHETVLLTHVPDDGHRQQALLAPETTLLFEFAGGDRVDLDRDLLEQLMRAANTNAGLDISVLVETLNAADDPAA